ncbi:MAG TPA: hypothetical protein ENK18_09460 [Deltaproteobacteria bacterium]|nr:hypothetical protein [Deltaproteobacteria bacterium]
MKRLLLTLLCVMATGCSKSTYISLVDGSWTGNATGADGVPQLLTTNFTFNEDQGEQGFLVGDADLGGWIYYVDQAQSDNKYAQVGMILNTAARYLNLIDVVVEEDTMTGSYEVNICWSEAGPTANTAGVVCTQPGTFSLNRL